MAIVGPVPCVDCSMYTVQHRQIVPVLIVDTSFKLRLENDSSIEMATIVATSPRRSTPNVLSNYCSQVFLYLFVVLSATDPEWEDNLEFLEFVNFVEEGIGNVRIPKRYIRDAENPFEFYMENEFKQIQIFKKYYHCVAGDLRGVSQQSVSVIIKRVSVLLAEQRRRFIKFPDTENGQRQNITRFAQIANFPGVGACVDGTHIPIANPGGINAEVFRTEKGTFH
ncbi:hypothetical protein NQ317_007692 [Molorchus minor]|uniref:Nuclease HARBI1 n=1 Tax=Molorchus minor TaxID=1323400 RepID=A0ABQ9JPC2_9CUCU|nr:hypothetical protein NQ317_007692 [Molorchus minor]